MQTKATTKNFGNLKKKNNNNKTNPKQTVLCGRRTVTPNIIN